MECKVPKDPIDLLNTLLMVDNPFVLATYRINNELLFHLNFTYKNFILEDVCEYINKSISLCLATPYVFSSFLTANQIK